MNDYRQVLQKIDRHVQRIKCLTSRPRLQLLYWEATRNCNLSCRHCFNPRMGWQKDGQLSTEQAKRIFSEIAGDFNPREICLAITGGEPTLRKDLTEVVKFLSALSFRDVTLVSNGLKFIQDLSLLDALVESGLTGLGISVDGLREGYKRIRGVDRFDEIIKLLRYVVSKYTGKLYFQTVSVVNNCNKNEMPQLMEVLSDIGIKFCRLGLVCKVGRAEAAYERLHKLGPEDLYNLLQWIARKRQDYEKGRFPMEIVLTEDGWCGLKYELLTKPVELLFSCTTGINIASILHDGKISACPYISPNLSIQGDALQERFRDVWDNRFQLFRDKSWLKQGKCKCCDQWSYCKGGPLHYRDENGMMTKCLYDEIREVEEYEKTLIPQDPAIPEKGGMTMARIKIKDLPKDRKISKEEMRKVVGGAIGGTSTYSFNPINPMLAAASPFDKGYFNMSAGVR